MMRRVFITLLLLVISVAAALWFERQGGFVMIRVADLTLQTSLFVALIVVLATAAVFAIVGRLLRNVGQLPGRFQQRIVHRRGRLARQELVDGLIELAEGQYARAEKRLETTSDHAVQPLLYHLLAALAAQRQGEWERRDDQLAAADAAEPRARLAVGLVQAQLQVEAKQWEQARATLGWLREKAPHNHRVLMLLARAMQALDDQDGLAALLPELRKQQALSDEEVQLIEKRTLVREFEALGETPSTDELARIWRALPRPRRRDPGLRVCYARALITAGHDDVAERMLRRWLDASWEPALVAVYGELSTTSEQQAYKRITAWLKERPDDPTLLVAAARQASACALWGQAKSFLEAAAARSDAPEVDRRLAELYEQLDEPDQARAAYRRALDHQQR
ncbi:MAG: heme biosynthesis HemY N-terminal domain-containing protein [Spiribacter sp.]|jgi:HemY protein|nr:heme biosynthesis HemY N-terminal domain-containing protein [Spiribacter sp.]